MPVGTGHSYVVVWEIDGPCINQVPHLFAVNINSDAGNGQLPVDIAIVSPLKPGNFPKHVSSNKSSANQT